MIATVWLMLSGLLYSLQLQTGSFPKPLTATEEQHYLALAAQGDLEARNILIERNLRLVAHIMKKYYAQVSDQEDLISIGTIGLIKAVNTFRSGKNIKLAIWFSANDIADTNGDGVYEITNYLHLDENTMGAIKAIGKYLNE